MSYHKAMELVEQLETYEGRQDFFTGFCDSFETMYAKIDSDLLHPWKHKHLTQIFFEFLTNTSAENLYHIGKEWCKFIYKK